MPGREVHLVNPLWDAAGGSEWRTLSLFDELKAHGSVSLWSEADPDPLLSRRYPVRRIVPRQGRFPITGVLVFIGAYHYPGRWVYCTLPRRVILIYNTFTPTMLEPVLRRLSARGLRRVEMVYASSLIERSVRLPGIVQPSLIDLDRFAPRERTRKGDPIFTVGRLSRDVPEKHHPRDPAFYRRLVQQGFRVSIMGGECMRPLLTPTPGLTLLPTCTQGADLFLQGLDCFFYRTSEEWLEACGRVVLEAMASGLPVVCHRRGGYVEFIDHGRNGFLFDTEEEAFEILQCLREDVDRRDAVGREARKTAEALFSPARRAEIAEFFLR